MATADAIQDLATQLATDLAAAEAVPATFSQEFEPAMRWLPLYELEDLNAVYEVSLVPDSEEGERASRNTFTREWTVAAIVQTKVGDDLAAVSAAADLAKEIREWIEANAKKLTLSGGTKCTLLRHETFLPGRRRLKTDRLVAAGVNLTYYVGA